MSTKIHTVTLTEHDAWGRTHTWSITWTPLRVSHRNNPNMTTLEHVDLWGEDDPPAWPVPSTTAGGVHLTAPAVEHAGIAYSPSRVATADDVKDPGDYHAEEI